MSLCDTGLGAEDTCSLLLFFLLRFFSCFFPISLRSHALSECRSLVTLSPACSVVEIKGGKSWQREESRGGTSVVQLDQPWAACLCYHWRVKDGWRMWLLMDRGVGLWHQMSRGWRGQGVTWSASQPLHPTLPLRAGNSQAVACGWGKKAT